MTTQKVAMTAIIVSAITSFLTTLLTSWLTSRRGRRQTLWERDVDWAEKLNELADDIYEVISSTNSPLEKIKEKLFPLLDKLEQIKKFEQKGKFLLKYEGMDEAMDDFLNGVYYVHYSDEIDPEFIKSFQESYKRLRIACEMVLKGKGK